MPRSLMDLRPVPRRRDRILSFDRLNGIADLADRLMEVWPSADDDEGDVARSRAHVDELERSVERLVRIVGELRTELDRIEREGP
jgi:hypothetical protein